MEELVRNKVIAHLKIKPTRKEQDSDDCIPNLVRTWHKIPAKHSVFTLTTEREQPTQKNPRN